LLFIALSIAVIFTMFPFFWLVISSIKPGAEIFAIRDLSLWKTFVPERVTFEQYIASFIAKGGLKGALAFPRYLINSVVISSTSSLLVIAMVIPGGYALARYKFPGKRVVSILVIVFQMLPAVLLVLPYYVIMRYLNLLDTWYALIIVDATFAIPFCIWLMRGFFSDVPREIEEAAMVDGCSELRAFLVIAVPLTVYGIIAAFIYAFTWSWNDYLFALILTSTINAKTVQVGLSELLVWYGEMEWGLLLAQSVMATIPIAVLFASIQRYLVSGLAAGALKG